MLHICLFQKEYTIKYPLFYISERIEANYRLDGRKFNRTQLKEHKSKVIFKGCLYTIK